MEFMQVIHSTAYIMVHVRMQHTNASASRHSKLHLFLYCMCFLQVELFLPGVDRLPPDVESLPTPSYFVARLPLAHFIQPDILSRYVLLNEGALTALSIGRRVDIDDVYALLPSGIYMYTIISTYTYNRRTCAKARVLAKEIMPLV